MHGCQQSNMHGYRGLFSQSRDLINKPSLDAHALITPEVANTSLFIHLSQDLFYVVCAILHRLATSMQGGTNIFTCDRTTG